MKNLMYELFCVAAAGAFVIGGAQAQAPMSSDTMKADAPAKAEAAYMAAKEACEAKTDGDKAVCLKDAQTARDKAAGTVRPLGSSPPKESSPSKDDNPPPTKDAT